MIRGLNEPNQIFELTVSKRGVIDTFLNFKEGRSAEIPHKLGTYIRKPRPYSTLCASLFYTQDVLWVDTSMEECYSKHLYNK